MTICQSFSDMKFMMAYNDPEDFPLLWVSPAIHHNCSPNW